MRSHSSRPVAPATSAHSTDVFHNARDGMPNSERHPSGVNSMATPSWQPVCEISGRAGLQAAQDAPVARRRLVPGRSGTDDVDGRADAGDERHVPGRQAAVQPGREPGHPVADVAVDEGAQPRSRCGGAPFDSGVHAANATRAPPAGPERTVASHRSPQVDDGCPGGAQTGERCGGGCGREGVTVTAADQDWPESGVDVDDVYP